MQHPARRELFAAAILAAAMWLTRSHQIDDHFGSFIDLPDTSWAVFFIAGLLRLRWWAPTALIMNAGVIDYLALLAGVSDYCVTPAYPFLIPTYLTLWASGRWSVFDFAEPGRSLLRVLLGLTLGVIGAFIISNASFYALAGYFASTPPLQYAHAVLRYLPEFLESAAVYTAVALAVMYVQHTRAAHAARPVAGEP
jgi:hypothetical protein